jgi:thioredoxin-like negative regulator of GroEL
MLLSIVNTSCCIFKHLFNVLLQLAVEYEENAIFVKVDTDDEYELAKDMQVS